MDVTDIGKTPISEDQPAGVDIRYEPDFDALQAEIDKLSSPTSSGTIDWNRVATLSADILAEKSKDILVASYFAVSQIHTSGLDGLAVGLQVYHDLLANFWETLYPKKKRIRGRIAAIEWWLEKTDAVLSGSEPQSLDLERKNELLEQCSRIDGLLDEFLDGSGLTCRPISRFVEQISAKEADTSQKPQVQDKEPPAVADKKPVAEEIQQNTSNPPAAPVSVTADASKDLKPKEAVQQALQILVRTAPALNKENPASPLSYQLLRFALWTPLEVLPPVTDGKTLIPPPDPQFVAMLQDLTARADWHSLIQTAETQLRQSPFWLDLNRFTCQALENLGQPYNKASDAVIQEVQRLLDRLPGLITMLFSDGRPMADQESQEWIQSLSATDDAMPPSLMSQLTATAGAGESLLATRMQEAESLLKEQKLLEAVVLLQDEVKRSGSEREKVLWQLALCKILSSGKQAETALPLFDQLVDTVDKFKLTCWEPALALEVYMTVWNGLQRLPKKGIEDRLNAILQMITRIDTVTGLRLKKP